MRAGVALPEMLLVAWLFAFVLAAAAAFAQSQGRLVALSRDQVRGAEVVRSARIVLGAELRSLAPADLRIEAGGLGVRAVRGGGPVCDHSERAVVAVYSGVRNPDPDKDSVLVITAGDPRGRALGLEAVEPGGCGLRLVLDGTVGSGAASPQGRPALALVFESGRYEISSGALRYRRGAGGRQPLTEALVRDASLARERHGIRLDLSFHPDSLPRLTPTGRTVRLSLALLNGSAP